MEIFSALLTAGLLTWFFYVVKTPRLRPGPSAGALLLTLHRVPSRRRYLAVALGLFGLVAMTLLFVFLLNSQPAGHPPYWSAFQIVIISAGVAASLRARHNCIEVREAGLVMVWGDCVAGAFTPWDQVKYCKWTLRPGTLLVQFRHLNTTYRIVPDDVATANRVLPRFVELRDKDGVRIESSDDTPISSAPAEPPPRLRMFQFDLKMLLLLVLVIASASGWMAIHYRKVMEVERAKNAERGQVSAPHSDPIERGAWRGRRSAAPASG